jgi:thiol-disulfide isomerase/thioredoxin
MHRDSYDRRPGKLLMLTALAGLLVVFLGVLPSCGAPQAGSPEKPQGEVVPPGGQAEGDPFAVPDGTPEQLVRYLQGLLRQRPPSRDPVVVKAFAAKLGRSALETGERILAAKPQPNDEQAAMGVRAKMLGYNILTGFGDKEAAQKLQQLPATLEKAGWPKLVRVARTILLQIELEDSEGDPAQFKKFQERVKKHLADGAILDDEAQLAMTTARASEELGDAVAAGAYRDLGQLLAASGKKQIVSLSAKMQGAARRLALVGRKLDLEGKTVSGKPLDWAKYRGKVVLVQFWATWCGPCRVAISQIRPLYRAYRGNGFEVLGISIDQDREELDAFLKDSELPWETVSDTVAISGDKDNSMATRYGVFGVPELVLVDKEGTVIARGLHGDALEQQLEKLLGPATAPKPENKDAEKASKPAKAGNL